MATREEVILALGAIAAGFPEIPVSEAMIDAWTEDLREFPAEHVHSAAVYLRRNSSMFPRIAMMRKTADEAWTHAKSLEASRTLRLSEPRADPNDPRVKAARDALARKFGRTKTGGEAEQ